MVFQFSNVLINILVDVTPLLSFCLPLSSAVIFLPPPPRGGKDQLRDDTPRLNVFFSGFFLVFNVNLGFVHVYTPQFQIPRNNTALDFCTGARGVANDQINYAILRW